MMNKTFDMEVKTVRDDYSFEGYASTFGGEPDKYGDVIEPGAFTKSLSRHRKSGKLPALLLHHDMHRPIGVYKSMEEDDHGLHVTGQLTEGVRDADEAYRLMKAGALHSMSIGYIPVDEEYDSESKVNYVKEIDLWEVSLVTIPANEHALITGVKAVADLPTNLKDLEAYLRDADGANLSRRDAKTFISKLKDAFREDIRKEIAMEALLNKIKQEKQSYGS